MKNAYAQGAKLIFGNVIFWIVAAAAGIYFVGRSTGKNKGTTRLIAPVDTEKVTIDAVSFAQRIYNVFAPWNVPGPFPGQRGELLGEMLDLTDENLKAVYNSYNEQFTKPPKTLVSMLQDEIIFNSPRSLVVKRMQALGLT